MASAGGTGIAIQCYAVTAMIIVLSQDTVNN